MTIKIQLSPKRCQQVTVSINPSGTMNIQIESGCHCKRNTGTCCCCCSYITEASM